MEIDETTQRHLKRFTTDAIVSEIQKKDLKRHKLIEWSHGFWHLTVTGRELAEQLGFLAQREGGSPLPIPQSPASLPRR